MPFKYPAAQIDYAVSLRAAGKTLAQASAESGVGITAIHKHCASRGVEAGRAYRIDSALMEQAVSLFVGGKSTNEAAAEVGFEPTALCRELAKRGIPTRGNALDLPADEICKLYREGVSELELAKRFNAARSAIRRRLLASGVQLRSGSEANLLRAARMSPEARAASAAAANAACRGVSNSLENKLSIARGREAAGWNSRTSTNEKLIDGWLREHGVTPVREKAIGIYNADFAIGPVAVEVLGGNWHAYKRTHAERTPYILNEGWTLLFMWSIRRAPLCAEAGEYVVSYVEETSRNPALRGQYRVIRGDGKLVATGSADDDEFPLVPPSVRGFSGRPLDDSASRYAA